jgi:serine/threonine protein kinase
MSVESSGKAKEIFLAAIDVPIGEERERFLNNACQSNHELRRRVDALISAHESPESLLDGNAHNLDAGEDIESTIGLSEMEKPGTHIGPYKLRERLGVGGMGVVWAAEQKQPISRKVAIKIVKPGMDTEQVLARFDAEREALSLMDHPNIARVLDAGVTDQGRPYFVMELIRGVPITDYCDANKLTIRERLELFTQVCRAVQHAHQKGIIHRDIKPSNVLVGDQDGEPIIKVIDFGVAKALFHSANENSVYSGVFQAIGTLAYMSPEQAGLSISDIDTRADVYSLGVLLYELITGDTPFDKERLKRAAIDEAFRIIRENDPPKPSMRASTLGEKSRSIAQCRQTDANGMYKSIRGDLDWIVMKCLDKDRKRRYETSNGLAEDIQHYLKNEEIKARAPSALYRFRKMLLRNRVAALIIALLIALLAVSSGLGWTSYLNLRRAQIPSLTDSALRREQAGDFAAAAEKYAVLIDLERHTSERLVLARHKSSYGYALHKIGRFSDAEHAFDSALTNLSEVQKSEELRAAALTIQERLAQCANDILAQPNPSEAQKEASLRLAHSAIGLSGTYGFHTTLAAYAALARSQYENQQYRHAISSCLRWLSNAQSREQVQAYLILSAAYGHVGDLDLARDWWLAAENILIPIQIRVRSDFASLRDEARSFFNLSGYDQPASLTVEQELLLYSRLLDRHPDLVPLRKYQGYCLFQLGRWTEARDSFNLLIRRGSTDAFIVVSATLLNLFYEPESKEREQLEALRQILLAHGSIYDVVPLTVVTMLADREGYLVGDDLYRHVAQFPVSAGFVLYRANRPTDAYSLLLNQGGLYTADDVVADILRGLIEWKNGEEVKARASLARAEEAIERLGPREGIAKTNTDMGFLTSVVWLEPLLMLREARETIPREDGEAPKPIDQSLYPKDVP